MGILLLNSVLKSNLALISYMNLMDSAANRRERLESLYYFLCRCRRCLNPHMDWPLYSMRCQTVTCLGKPVFVGCGKSAADLEAKPCSECGNKPKPAVRAFEALQPLLRRCASDGSE